MQNKRHSFHIPVLGIGFTIDTPVKVAKYGISSVISLVDDLLIEKVREYYSHKYNEEYLKISESDSDHRAHRITAYLNLLNKIVNAQIKELKASKFSAGSDINKYFEILPEDSSLKKEYNQYLLVNNEKEKLLMEESPQGKYICRFN